jgi:hypothetical protein
LVVRLSLTASFAAIGQPTLPFDLRRCDRINLATVMSRLGSLTTKPDVDVVGCGSYGRDSQAVLSRFSCILRNLERLDSSSTNVTRLVSPDLYTLLDKTLCTHVYSLRRLRGTVANELAFLGCLLSVRGGGQLGAVVQMTPAQVIACAAAIPIIRKPETMPVKLEKILTPVGLALNMRAPGWSPRRGPTLEELIATRDHRREAQALIPGQGQRPRHLQLVVK